MRFSIFLRVQFALVFFVGGICLAQETQRAKPPQFDPGSTNFLFSNDVFAEALEGERPEVLSESRQAGPAMTAPGSTPGASPSAAGSGSESAWKNIISPTTLQDEVKRINTDLLAVVENVRKFNGGGFEEARREFTVLAMLFEIIRDYDGDVRWKEYAATARDGFARAGVNCKVGTDNSYKEAKLRSEDLEQLVRGGSIEQRDVEEKVAWDKISDRPPLMQRLDIAFLQRVKKMTASESEFRANIEEVLHEAELIAAIGYAMHQDGFEYSDDDDYVAYCQQMQQAALDVAKAAKDNNAEAARKAAGEIDKSCTSCHDGYR